MDGDLKFQLILAFELLGEADVLVYGAKPALDVIILSLVEVLEVLGFCSGLVGGDGAEAVSFAGGIGADEVDLAGSLELGGELVRIGFAAMAEGILEIIVGG